MNPFLFHSLQLFPLPLAICPPNFTSSLILTKSPLLPVCEWVGYWSRGNLSRTASLKELIPPATTAGNSSSHSFSDKSIYHLSWDRGWLDPVQVWLCVIPSLWALAQQIVSYRHIPLLPLGPFYSLLWHLRLWGEAVIYIPYLEFSTISTLILHTGDWLVVGFCTIYCKTINNFLRKYQSCPSDFFS